MVYSRLTPSVPEIGFEFTATLTRIKWLLEMNEGICMLRNIINNQSVEGVIACFPYLDGVDEELKYKSGKTVEIK